VHSIGLSALRRGIVHSLGACNAVRHTVYTQVEMHNYKLTLGSTPVTLSHHETAADGLGVHLASLSIHDGLFRLNHRPRLALVVNTNDLVAQLKLLASTSRRKRLQDSELALAVDRATGVEFGNTRDRVRLLTSIEIRHFLVGELEGYRKTVLMSECKGYYEPGV
jgi:hypothetical protein